MGHVARTGDEHRLAGEVFACRLEHVLEEVHVAIARGFGADARTAELLPLTREDALEAVGELLVHTEHVAHFAATHADVACGYVFIGSDVSVEFGHESLTEAHHLGIALATGREVGTALGTAHGERRE